MQEGSHENITYLRKGGQLGIVRFLMGMGDQ